MAHTRTQRRENELPYIPFGPFQIRLPFIHYKIESVEFIQGLILGVTALEAVPYLEQYLGLPYELAWSCVIIETFLYLLHSLLGDPVVPGWITPTLPLTIVFLEGFPMGEERIQAMIALQMLVGLVFIYGCDQTERYFCSCSSQFCQRRNSSCSTSYSYGRTAG